MSHPVPPNWSRILKMYGSIPISTPIHSGMSKSSNPYSSESTGTRGTGTRIPIGTTDPPCGFNVSPEIDYIWQSPTPYLRKSKEFDNSIDGKFTKNLVSLPIFTEVLCKKLCDSSCPVIYTHCRMNLTADPVNVPIWQFVYLDLYIIDALDEGTSLWTSATIVGRPMDVAYWSAPNNIYGKIQRLETL